MCYNDKDTHTHCELHHCIIYRITTTTKHHCTERNMNSESLPSTAQPQQEQQQSSSSTLSDLDKSMFGDVNTNLANALEASCKLAIRNGVDSLPLLKEREGLVKKITHPYMKNVDVIEAYGKRRLFTVRYTGGPKRCQQIANRFLDVEAPLDISESRSSSARTDSHNASSSSSAPYPSKEEIPSSLQLETVQAELQVLAKQLADAKAKRNALLQQGVDLQAAHSAATLAVESLQSKAVAVASIPDSVSAAVMGGQGLQDLTREAKRMQTELTEKKRSAEDDNTDATIFPQLPCTKKRVLTSHELYQQERQAVKVSSAGISNLLGTTRTLNNENEVNNNN